MTDSATTCETSRFSIPETIASRNTYQVNRGLVVTLPSEAQTYSHLPAGYSDRWLTLSVSPFLTFTPSRANAVSMLLGSGYFHEGLFNNNTIANYGYPRPCPCRPRS